MKRLWLILALAACLGGCGATDIMMGVATLGGAAVSAKAPQRPAVVVPMKEDDLDQRVRLATEVGNRMADYFENEKLPTSTSPDTAHPMFCPMVIADMAQIGQMDDGGLALAIKCRITYQRGKAKDAFEDRDPTAYNDHLGKLDGLIAQLTLILDRHKGASQ